MQSGKQQWRRDGLLKVPFYSMDRVPDDVQKRYWSPWYYIRGGQVMGPVYLRDLEPHLKGSHCQITHVWTEEFSDWREPQAALSDIECVREVELSHYASASLLLGIASGAVLRPPGNLLTGLSLPIAALAAYFGIQGLKSKRRQFAIYGLILASSGPAFVLLISVLLLLSR